MRSYAIIYRTGAALSYKAGSSIQDALVEKKIKTFSYWANILDHYWFVKTDYTANQIYEILNPLVGLNGRLIVVGLKRNASWNYISTSDFLYKHL